MMRSFPLAWEMRNRGMSLYGVRPIRCWGSCLLSGGADMGEHAGSTPEHAGAAGGQAGGMQSAGGGGAEDTSRETEETGLH